MDKNDLMKIETRKPELWKIAAVVVLLCVVGVFWRFSYQSTDYLIRIAQSNSVSFPKSYHFQVQDYTSLYMAIAAFIGNVIQLFVMVFTLYILLVQITEIRNSNDRYEQDKKDRDAERKEEKAESDRLLAEQQRRHNELMDIEREKLRHEKIKREKSEIIELINIVSSRIDSFEAITGRNRFQGDLAIKVLFDELVNFRNSMIKHKAVPRYEGGTMDDNIEKFKDLTSLCYVLINQTDGIESESMSFFKEIFGPIIHQRIDECAIRIKSIGERASELNIKEEQPRILSAMNAVTQYISLYDTKFNRLRKWSRNTIVNIDDGETSK